MHKLEETEGQGEFLLGNAPMRAQPTPQQRPVTVDGRITPSTSASEPRVRAFHARGSSVMCPLASAPFRSLTPPVGLVICGLAPPLSGVSLPHAEAWV